jgi:transcriptional regulator of acetoin/glycerol metabolism
MELFTAYEWPGNVRELQNVLEQTLLLSPFSIILPENLPERLQQKQNPDLPPLTPLEAAERAQILQTLKTTLWNQSRAAQLLGIDRKTLRAKIQRYGMAKDSKQ